MIQHRTIQHASKGTREMAISSATIGDHVARLQGKEPDFRLRLAKVAASRNDHDLAEPLLRALHQESPAVPKITQDLANYLSLQGRFEEARSLLEPLVHSVPADAQLRANLAAVLIQLQEVDAAREHARAALSLDPTDPLAKQILTQAGDPEAENVRPISFDKATGQLSIPEELLSQPGLDLGIPIAAALVRAHPEQAEALLADLARDNGVAYAKQVAQLAYHSPTLAVATTHFEQAEALFAKKKMPESLREYTLAIEENLQKAAAYTGAGDCYYMMGKMNLAAAFFEESIAIEPKATTLRFLGDAYQRSNRLEAAARAYEQALELNPSYDAARQQLQLVRQALSSESK
jgi:tetratricopeptide (TPR) repeat protein